MSKEIEVYGMTREDIEEFYINSITAKLSGLEMVVAGILSDCQELAGNTEQVRKQLNVAKFILFRMMDENDVQARYRKKLASLKDIPRNYGKETV
jgi:hypothetical protein